MVKPGISEWHRLWLRLYFHFTISGLRNGMIAFHGFKR